MVWVLLAIAFPLLLLTWRSVLNLFRQRAVIISVIVVAIAALFALGWLFGSSSLFAGLSSDKPSSIPFVGASAFTGFWLTFTGTFDYGYQMVGFFGWLDTPTIDLVYFVWSVFIGTVVLAGFVVLRGRYLVVGILLMAAFLFVPPLVQAVYITGGGLIWQGRYSLPAFLCMMIGVMALIANQLDVPLSANLAKRLSLVILLAWGLCQAVSFGTTLQRYAVGLEGTWRDTFLAPQWNAPLGNFVLVCAYVLALGVVCVFLSRQIIRLESLTGGHKDYPTDTVLQPKKGLVP